MPTAGPLPPGQSVSRDLGTNSSDYDRQLTSWCKAANPFMFALKG
jgi:hypothetical protein